MLQPLSQSQVKGIVDSFKRVFANNNIDYLTKNAYNFIMLSSGFIAHYNLHGFRDYYREVYDFATDIDGYREANRWENFRPGDKDYDYYHQKAEIYAQIADLAESFLYK